jgi:5'-3' exonuclease
MSHSAATQIEESPDQLAVQVPMIIDTLTALGLAIVGKDGYEADDVVGTLARTAGIPVDVVTGDRDLFQLVDDERSIRVLYTARGVGKHDRVDDAWLQNRFGVPAAGYRDFATLKGDPSDGLPGVAGVGEKTAAGLVTGYGSIEGILAAASVPKSPIAPGVRAKLAAAIDYLAVAPQVVGVVDDLDLGVTLDDLVLPSGPADAQRFAELTEELGLGGSAERVVAALAGRDG